ncbi:WD repeat-containing and planar cell polarity effector protein fritz-like isoform X1 [Leptotrombidium deliense]|uniref:WD repeat-containing and planar cell polarity effector protein fritz-like isoform X1 n=1 Tax=Leptotrombidium deliense TaxID=299467 RepID=A0A443S719_9ACAR|nr:WD repeat-containing and planar cell polarity effector protein fritz-like isoform X1 [Leptotrombidium deliense]
MFCLNSSRVVRLHQNSEEKSEKAKQKKLERRLKQLGPLIAERNSNISSQTSVICLQWSNIWTSLSIVFNTGLIVRLFYECSNLQTLKSIYFDKFLVGKLVSDHIVKFIINETFIFVSYNEPKITAIFMESSETRKGFKLKSKARLKQFEFDVSFNCTKRRVERNLVVNTAESLLIVWWQNGCNFISPWAAPHTSQTDLINVFVYDYFNQNLNLVSFVSIMNDILKHCVNTPLNGWSHASVDSSLVAGVTLNCLCSLIRYITFSRMNSKQVFIVENSNNDLLVNLYDINISSESEVLHVINSYKIPISQKCLKVEFNATTDKLVILCEDRTVKIFHFEFYSTISFYPSINAVDIVCPPMDSFFVICDHFGQILMYDYSLNVIPANYDDLILNEASEGLDHIEFLTEKLISLKFVGDENVVLIVLPFNIDFLTLESEYVRHEYTNEAISNLRSLSWNCSAHLLYSCINSIFNHLLKQPLNAIRQTQMEELLAVFFNPHHPVKWQIVNDYKLEMYYLARKFFFKLLRYNCFEKAFLLAIDLNSRPLFMLLYKMAKEKGYEKLAEVAFSKCESIVTTNMKHNERLNNNDNNNEIESSVANTSSSTVPQITLDKDLIRMVNLGYI